MERLARWSPFGEPPGRLKTVRPISALCNPHLVIPTLFTPASQGVLYFGDATCDDTMQWCVLGRGNLRWELTMHRKCTNDPHLNSGGFSVVLFEVGLEGEVGTKV